MKARLAVNDRKETREQVDILILGGTRFYGRAVAQEALRAGHQVTLFNRGRQGPSLFPELERLRGDRDGGLGVLSGRKWDVAIDMCGYVPRLVRESARALAGSVERYVFTSSIAACRDFSTAGYDEAGPVGTLPDAAVEAVDETTYGPLKALCERAAEEAAPGRVLVIRPGYIAGPHDPKGRITYWAARAARGGEMLAPGAPDQPLQFVDVRDLAAWTVRMAAQRATGVYQVTGPERRFTWSDLMSTCGRVAGPAAWPTWVGGGFLRDEGVGEEDLPMWSYLDPGSKMIFTADCSKAIAAGMRFRPVEDTVRDTLAWDRARDAGAPQGAGLAPAKERELLDKWHARPPANLASVSPSAL